ncbi:YHYH domain-containing protein (plasmid) [Cyanobacterium sp. IPPAS B-1200]|uniref:YHYH domain-containing protein n=1 Tax=Cyanobacterium sp. IPPAS B-1200 TaxID=1562720 RepID=UPI00269C0691
MVLFQVSFTLNNMKKKVFLASFLSTVLLLCLSYEGLAHSGRTNSDGCHRETKTDTYHCH